MELSGFTSVEARDRFIALYTEIRNERWPVHTCSTVETSFGPTAVFRTGEGPGRPVVLLAGGSANAAAWTSLLPALVANRPVLAIDVLGDAGGTRQTAALPDARARADWLHEVLTETGNERVHLVGHSAGAAIALAQAAHVPTELASVTALEPARALARVRAGFWFRLIAVLLTGSRRRAAAYLRWCRRGRDVPSPMRELLVSALVDHRSRAVPPPPRLSDEQLRSIDVPTLVALGAESPIHDVSRAARRGRLIPDAEVHVIPDAAHGLFSERPREAGRILSSFLARADHSLRDVPEAGTPADDRSHPTPDSGNEVSSRSRD